MKDMNKPSTKDPGRKGTAWSPLYQPVFRALWIASIVSNIGTWMQNTATAWLMTSITSSSVMVALVQTATSLPMFLLALPAGALADVLDRRRLILFTQAWMLAAAALLGGLTLAGETTPWILLTLTLLLGLGAAMNAPAWQAIIPELVTRTEIPSAVALNSAGFNVARSIGPALGGLVVGAMGAGNAFLINALSYLGVVVVLYYWKRPKSRSTLPAERMIGAMRTGVRFVRHAPALRAIFVRATAFITCASALMALLPILARHNLGLGSLGFGILLGSFGMGAVAGALILPEIRRRISIDLQVTLSTILFAVVFLALAYLQNFIILCGAILTAGAAWLTLLSIFNSSVQSMAPSWVRGRALAVYMFIFFGGMAAGSFLWGTITSYLGISRTFVLASLTMVAGLGVTARFRLASAEHLDLTPSMHWPAPTLAVNPQLENGPVLVMIEYHIDPADSHEFGMALKRLRNVRLRDGAIRWDLFVDAAKPERYIESFLVESWMEHLRQHERVTVADREVEKRVRAFHKSTEPPVVTHLLARALPK